MFESEMICVMPKAPNEDYLSGLLSENTSRL